MKEKLLWNAAEIRHELYKLLGEQVGSHNEHQIQVLRGEWPEPHVPSECKRCRWDAARIGAIKHVIRRFGGRIHR